MFNLQRFAALRVNEESSITLKVVTGQTASGANSFSNRTVPNINPVATDTKALQFATAYAALQSHTLDSVIRANKAELVDDE